MLLVEEGALEEEKREAARNSSSFAVIYDLNYCVIFQVRVKKESLDQSI